MRNKNADHATAALAVAGCATAVVASAGAVAASTAAVPLVSFVVQSREIWPAWPHL